MNMSFVNFLYLEDIMQELYRIWSVAKPFSPEASVLADELGVIPAFAQVLVNRGLNNINSARKFLDGCFEDLLDPFGLKDMDRAVKRILFAIDNKQQITVYGDYDVDGITACSLLILVLKDLGANVDFYIPERQSEGYGLNCSAIENIIKNGSSLIITVDCGVSAVSEIDAYKDKIDIIVTDHHEPPEKLPNAYALVNPRQKDCPYQDKNLAGVGVAFKLCQALLISMDKPIAELKKYLDIAAIGTVADIVPLVGENRIIVKEGLKVLEITNNIGLSAMLEVCKLTGSSIDSGKVSFTIAPRLNAAGRVSHASAGVELLITKDIERARNIALMLEDENRERQAIEKDILSEVIEKIEQHYINDKVFVIDGQEWHTGVIGIVASRIVERYFRPTIIISTYNDIGKGSCRSIPKFNMYKSLSQCRELLIQFGGHRQAAGLTISADHIDLLRTKLNKIAAQELTEKDYFPIVNIDSMVALEEINKGFIEQLSCLAPYGMGNPSPIFACENLAVTAAYPMGKDNKHLKLKVRSSETAGEIVAWNMGDMAEVINTGTSIALAFVPEISDWMGQKKIQLRAQDVKLAAEKICFKNNLIVDARFVNTECYLRQVLYSFEKTVIYINSNSNKNLFYEKLKANVSSKIDLIVSSYDEIINLKDFNNIVLYDVPYKWEHLRKILNEINKLNDVSLFFLYNQKGVNQAKELLVECSPDRKFIAEVYLLLKRCQTIHNGIQELLEKYHEFYLEKCSLLKCKLAIDILEQLGLIEIFTDIDGHSVIQLLPAPNVKLSLESAPLYQYIQKQKHETEEFIFRPLYYASSNFIIFINEVLKKLSEGRL